MNMTRSLFLGVSLLVAGSVTANDQIQVRGLGSYHAVEVGKSPALIAEAAGVRILGSDHESGPPQATADRLAVPHRAVSAAASTARPRPAQRIRYGTGRGYAPGIRYGNGVRYGSSIGYDKTIVYGSGVRYGSGRGYAAGAGYNRPAKR